MQRRTFLKKTGLATALAGTATGTLASSAKVTQTKVRYAEQPDADIIIVGATPAGITAAVAAARMGQKSLILERTAHIGGLPANGLGATDIQTRGCTGGLFLKFVNALKQHYSDTYGPESEQAKVCSDGYHFEPSVAEKIFLSWINEYKQYIQVITMRQLDVNAQYIEKEKGEIKSITLLNRTTGEREKYTGNLFLDCTYEGDLIALAGENYFMGREGKAEYNEPGAGKIYKYWGGPEGEGSTYLADNAVQAYNYRLCLTNIPANRVAITPPADYRRQEYVSMIEDVKTGNNTEYKATKLSEEQKQKNAALIQAGLPPEVPGALQGIHFVVNIVKLPNGKSDANNQHRAFISTDLPEENWPYPTADWPWRDRFAERLKNYTLGLLWFAQNDPELPLWFREKAAEWGLAKDEYTDNNNFPRQVYVREGRRLDGKHLFKAQDALPVSQGARPPVHGSSVTASHYALDSHAVLKREPDRVHLEGFLSYHTEVYTVPLGVMLPKKTNNLLAPVPVSATHIGFSTLRMEPCWMALGEAAGVCATLALRHRLAPANVPMDAVQKTLLSNGAVLMYFKDLSPEHECFAAAQFFALRGLCTDWEIQPEADADTAFITALTKVSGKKLKLEKGKKYSRAELMIKAYSI